MSILPRMMVGQLLEHLDAERQRVVLDGFDPHGGEWSGRWSDRRRGKGRRRDRDAEAEVLERTIEDIRAVEPGQPAAVDLVVALTAAIRRDPDNAVAIADALVTDHPKLAVVIVATALRLCPAQRKAILAMARRKKPFAKHPFILTILLVFAAHVLSEHAAEAAELFIDPDNPAPGAPAGRRNRSSDRPHVPLAAANNAGTSRAIGFATVVTPALVVTVLEAADARARTLDGAQDMVAVTEGPAVADASEVERYEPAAVTVADGLPDNRGVGEVTTGDDDAAAAGSAEAAQADVAAAADGPTPHAAMAAMGRIVDPAADAPVAAEATVVGPASPAADPPALAFLDRQVDDAIVIAADAGDRMTLATVGEAGEPLAAVGEMEVSPVATVSLAPADSTVAAPGGDPIDVEATAALGMLSQEAVGPAGPITGIDTGATTVLAEADGALLAEDSVLSAAVTVAASVSDAVAIEGSAGVDVLTDDTVVAVSADVGVEAGPATVQASVDVALLAEGSALALDAGVSAGLGDITEVGASASVDMLAGDGAVEASANVAIEAGPVAVQADALVVLLDDDTVVSVDAGLAASLGDAVDVAAMIGGDVLTDDVVASATIAAEVDAGPATVAAAATFTLFDDEAALSTDAAVSADVGEVVAAAASASLDLLSEDALVGSALTAEVEAGPVTVEAAAAFELDDEDGIAIADAAVGGAVGDVAYAAVATEIAVLPDGGVAEVAIEAEVSAGPVDVGASLSFLTEDEPLEFSADVAAEVADVPVAASASLTLPADEPDASASAAAELAATIASVGDGPATIDVTVAATAAPDTIDVAVGATVPVVETTPVEVAATVDAGGGGATAAVPDVASVAIEVTPGETAVEAAVTVPGADVATVEIAATIATGGVSIELSVPDVISVSLGLPDDGVDLSLEVPLPEPQAVVEDVAGAVETVADVVESTPPPIVIATSILPPPAAIPSVLFHGGGLFG
ncbi:MAG: hypothetical protein AB7P02_24605 [Alphaproteobacteria bacterium]